MILFFENSYKLKYLIYLDIYKFIFNKNIIILKNIYNKNHIINLLKKREKCKKHIKEG